MLTAGRIFPRCVLLFFLGCAPLLARAADDIRFTATLTPEQFTTLGLTALTLDNVAVIDGLVRQDEAASKFKDNSVDHTHFSQRRTTHERAIAGLDHLSTDQLTQLDELVRRRIAGPEPELTAATPVATSGAAAVVRPVKYQRPLEIHGEISYTYGWSKGGSFQGGDLVLTYDDPAHRFSILVGYSEYHGTGLPYCYYPNARPLGPWSEVTPRAP